MGIFVSGNSQKKKEEKKVEENKSNKYSGEKWDEYFDY